MLHTYLPKRWTPIIFGGASGLVLLSYLYTEKDFFYQVLAIVCVFLLWIQISVKDYYRYILFYSLFLLALAGFYTINYHVSLEVVTLFLLTMSYFLLRLSHWHFPTSFKVRLIYCTVFTESVLLLSMIQVGTFTRAALVMLVMASLLEIDRHYSINGWTWRVKKSYIVLILFFLALLLSSLFLTFY